jgi:NodT family efflux transporter outer membrane factor (OMF) lipoprotein
MRGYFLVVSALTLSGCAVGPNYQRPKIDTPTQFRDEPATSQSLSDTKWFDLFKDEKLTDLVKTALAQNYDMQIASARVLEERAQLGIVRADQFPNLSASAGATVQRASSIGSINFIPAGLNLASSYITVGLNSNWELDFWGRIRRLTESARAQYLASEEARHGVTTSLIGDVTTGYFNLREADLELQIARRTKTIADRSLELTTLRRDRGVATSLDVRQAEQFLYTATGQIAAEEKLIEQDENLLSFLTAKNPQAIKRGKPLTDFPTPPEIPAGLPSALLERRPDIRQAEQTLIAANANIGAAKAEYFPQITLTGFLGAQSRELEQLFTAAGRDQSILPNATLPIFNAGKIRSNVRRTQAEQQEALANYQKSIKAAFREVADAIVGYRMTAEQRAQEELLVKALRDADRLSTVRYEGGLDSYLQVLDAERNLFQGELDLARLRRDELVAIVTLYRALGGGWQ